jgi:hypothetical protein
MLCIVRNIHRFTGIGPNSTLEVNLDVMNPFSHFAVRFAPQEDPKPCRPSSTPPPDIHMEFIRQRLRTTCGNSSTLARQGFTTARHFIWPYRTASFSG